MTKLTAVLFPGFRFDLLKRQIILAICLVWPLPVMGEDIAAVTITSESTDLQTEMPVTFGHTFKEGDIGADQTLIAKLSDGSTIPLQSDRKTTHADGSLRHTVLTAEIPRLEAGASEIISLGTGSPISGINVTLEKLLSTSFDASVEITIAGKTYTASAKQLLNGDHEKKAWLSGPLVSEWIVGDSVRDQSNVAHPHLAAYFHIRAYGNNPVNRVRVDFVIENNWTFESNPSEFTYDVSLKIGDKVVYSKTDLTQYHHTRWKKAYWWGAGRPAVSVAHDYEYLQATKAVPNYKDGLVPSETVLNNLIQTVEPMDNGMLRTYFGTTGAGNQIGPLPLWDALYAVSGDERAYNATMANGDAAGSYSVHYRDKNTGLPVSIADHPNITIQDNSLPEASGGNPLTHDQGHQPSIAFLAYLITGDYFYLEEMQFWTTWNFLYAHGGTGGYREAEKGIFGITIRGQAWAMRNLGQTAYATPDTHPLKSYFEQRVIYNLEHNESVYLDNPDANALGALWSYAGYDKYAPWMDDFYTWSMGYLVELGFDEAVPMRNFKAKFPAGRMGYANDEYCYQLAVPYRYVIGTSDNQTDYWPNFRVLYEKTFPVASTYQCGSEALANYLTAETAGSFKVGEMNGYAHSADSYYANLQPALAIAVDAGVAAFDREWKRFTVTNPTTPDYNDKPIWAVVPRNTTGVSKPSIAFSASPTNFQTDGTTTVSWSAQNANSCAAVGNWTDSTATVGTQAVYVDTTTTFSLSCVGDGGSDTSSVTVTIGRTEEENSNNEGETSSGVGDSDAGNSTETNVNGGGGTGSASLWTILFLLGFGILARNRSVRGSSYALECPLCRLFYQVRNTTEQGKPKA